MASCAALYFTLCWFSGTQPVPFLRTLKGKTLLTRKEKLLVLIVGLAQVLGVLAIFALPRHPGSVITGIGGFAAVVDSLMPWGGREHLYKPIKILTALFGIGLMAYAIAR